MTRVRTASRLHFGLLRVPAADAAERTTAPADPLVESLACGSIDDPLIESPRRCFGGVGLMVDAPGVTVHAQTSADWLAVGPLAERVSQIITQLRQRWPQPLPACRVTVEHAPEPHTGLGVGTQLSLAVAAAVLHAAGARVPPAVELARLVQRGERSAVGVHGFACGGLIVDAGKTNADALGTLAVRQALPGEWRVVLLTPSGPRWHGDSERRVFGQAHLATPLAITNTMCRLIVCDLLPALAEADCEATGQALFAYNQLAGRAFAPVQGGTYASPAIAEAIAQLRGLGVAGVGQSSWGPTVFALCADADRAAWVANRAMAWSVGPVVIAAPCNHPAQLDADD